MMMLALVAGCSPAASEHADDRNAARPAQPTTLAEAPPVPVPQDVAALPEHPAPPPILPSVDPAMAQAPPPPEWPDDAEQVAAANRAMIGVDGPGTRFAVSTQPPAPVPDLPPGAGAVDPRPFPDEVTRYMVDRDSCDHFRGEDAYDADRRAYLEESVAELCTGTDARLAMLRQRYAQDRAVIAALGGYEDEIEGNASN